MQIISAIYKCKGPGQPPNIFSLQGWYIGNKVPKILGLAGLGRTFGVSRKGKKGQNIFRKRAISGTKQGHKNQM